MRRNRLSSNNKNEERRTENVERRMKKLEPFSVPYSPFSVLHSSALRGQYSLLGEPGFANFFDHFVKGPRIVGGDLSEDAVEHASDLDLAFGKTKLQRFFEFGKGRRQRAF